MVCDRQAGPEPGGGPNNSRASGIGPAYIAFGRAVDWLCGVSRLNGAGTFANGFAAAVSGFVSL